MNIPLLKKFKGNIDFKYINIAHISNIIRQQNSNLTSLLSKADKRALLKGLSVVAGFYIIIFSFVYIKSDTTLKAIEDTMPSEIIEVSKGDIFNHGKINHVYDKNINLVAGLSRFEDTGNIPIIRKSDQLTSFRAYQTPFNFNDIKNKNLLSFMVADFGLSEKMSNMALDILPPQVSFLLSPYADLPMEWIKRAREKGHEIWIDLPIQNKKNIDQGINTIFHHQNLSEKTKMMHKTLASALGYVGVAMYMDKSSESVTNHYKQLTNELYGRGIGIFEKNPNAPKYIEAIAIAKGAPYIKVDLQIYQMHGKNSFQEVEAITQNKGYAVALIPSYPKAIKNLAVWIEKVGKIDYAIAPISAIYDLPLERDSPSYYNGLKPSDHIAKPVINNQDISDH